MVSVGPTLVFAIIVFVGLISSCIHQVNEGHVGVYWRGGALLSQTTRPGFHLKLPLITAFSEVQVTVQTDYVLSIPCGTSGGVMLTFDKVEVVNRLREDYVHDTVKNYTVNYDRLLIFDKIHSLFNEFCSKHELREVYITLFDTLDESLQESLQEGCSKWAPGIEIIAVRVTKPVIPKQLRENFERMEAERTKLLIATQHQKVVEKEAETDLKRATIKAEMVAAVSKINMEKEIREKEAQKTIAAIEDAMHLEREKAIADAEFYRASKEALANQERLTPEFLQYTQLLAMANNTKVYFGENIPGVYVDRSPAQHH